MVDDDIEKDEDVEQEAKGSQKRDTRKMVLIFVAAAGLIIAGAGVAHYYGLLSPLLAKLTGGEYQPAQVADAGPVTVYYDLPEILVNLSNADRRSSFLKLRVSLELASERDAPAVETWVPRIVDNFHMYLRELRVEELKGAEGLHRLQRELFTRVTAVTAPARVETLLLKEIMVQ